MPTSKSSLDKRDVYYRKGKSDGAYAVGCWGCSWVLAACPPTRPDDEVLCQPPPTFPEALTPRLSSSLSVQAPPSR